MATTYTCDKCGHVLTRTDRDGGAHRLKVKDMIPWVDDSPNREKSALNTAWDLCDACLLELKYWIKECVPNTRTRDGGENADS